MILALRWVTSAINVRMSSRKAAGWCTEYYHYEHHLRVDGQRRGRIGRQFLMHVDLAEDTGLVSSPFSTLPSSSLSLALLLPNRKERPCLRHLRTLNRAVACISHSSLSLLLTKALFLLAATRKHGITFLWSSCARVSSIRHGLACIAVLDIETGALLVTEHSLFEAGSISRGEDSAQGAKGSYINAIQRRRAAGRNGNGNHSNPSADPTQRALSC